MAKRYPRVTGSKKISQDYDNINEMIDMVEEDVDSLDGRITQTDRRLDTVIGGSSPTKDPELTDIRTPDPVYTPERPINVAGDMMRDMQKQFSEQLAEKVNKTVVEKLANDKADKVALDATNAEVALKANHNEVRLKRIKLELEDMSDQVVSAISGGTTLNVLSIPQDESVSPKKTTFLREIIINLFDKTKTTTGLVVRATGEVDPSWADYQTSDFIMLEQGKTYHTTKAYELVYYNENKTLVSSASAGGEAYDLVLPVNGRYVRISYANTDIDTTAITEVGKEYYLEIRDNAFKTMLQQTTENQFFPLIPEKIKGNIAIPQVADGNLFDYTKVTHGKYVKSDGTLGDTAASVFVSDYMLVEPSTSYTFYKTLQFPGGWYDINGNYISSLPASNNSPFSIESPPNAKYLRWCGDASTPKAEMMIVEGNLYPTEYIPYVSPKNKYALDWLDINVDKTSKWHKKNLIMFGDSIVWYDGNQYPSGTTAVGYLSNMNSVIGFASMLNKGVSGASIAVDQRSYEDVVTTVQTVTDFSLYDICLIAGGTNDLFNDVPLGSIGGIADTTFDTSTFYGAYRKIIEHILGHKPTIQLVLFTPLQRNGFGYNIDTSNAQGHKLIDYVVAIKKIGEMYSVPVLDLYTISGVNKMTLSKYTIDGLHLNNEGYAHVTNNKIIPFLETI